MFELKGTEELAMDYDVFGKFVNRRTVFLEQKAEGSRLTYEDCFHMAADGKPTWWF